jgi:hypothetical protein
MMARCLLHALGIAVVFISTARVDAQTPDVPPAADAQGDASREAARQKILDSDPWREAQRKLDDWFAVQQVYGADEVAALRAEIADRVKQMSPEGLEAFLNEMQDRLAVLLSPDAEEARTWIGQILAVVRDPEQHFGGPLPDVLNMSAGEIRAELQQFQQRRMSRRQAQSAFDTSRQAQVQAVREEQAARREVLSQPRTAATFPDPPYRSQYAPEPLRPVMRRPVYRIGPWGEPIFWDPLGYWRAWRRSW